MVTSYEHIPVGTMVWAQQTANKPKSGSTAKIIEHLTWSEHVMIQWNRGDRESLPLSQISVLMDDRSRSCRSTRRAPDRFAEQPAAKKAAKGRNKKTQHAAAKKPATKKRTAITHEVISFISSDENDDKDDDDDDEDQQQQPPSPRKRAAISSHCPPRKQPPAAKRSTLPRVSGNKTRPHVSCQVRKKDIPSTERDPNKKVPVNKIPVKHQSVLSNKEMLPKRRAAGTNRNKKNVARKQSSTQPPPAADCIDLVVEEDEYSDMELSVAEFMQTDLPIGTMVSVKSAQKSGARESARIISYDGDDKVKIKWAYVGYCSVVPLTQIRALCFDAFAQGRSKRARRGTQHFTPSMNSDRVIIKTKQQQQQQHSDNNQQQQPLLSAGTESDTDSIKSCATYHSDKTFDYPSVTKDPHGTKQFISQSLHLFSTPLTTIRNDKKEDANDDVNDNDSKSTGLCTQEPLLEEGGKQNDDEHSPLDGSLSLPVVEIDGGISVDDENYFASVDNLKLTPTTTTSRSKRSRISTCNTVHSPFSNKPAPNFNKQHGRRTATPNAMKFILGEIFCSKSRPSDATAESQPIRKLFADDEDLS